MQLFVDFQDDANEICFHIYLPSAPPPPPLPIDLCAAALTYEGERPRPTSGSAADVKKTPVTAEPSVT